MLKGQSGGKPMKLSEILDSNRKNNLIFFNYAKQDEVLSLKALKQEVSQALKENKVNEALQLAAQAAVLYGSAGLLLHHQASMAELRLELKEPFGAETQGLNALAKLYLCRQIIDKDDEEKQRVIETFPEVPADEDTYWKQLEDELIKLMNFEQKQLDYAADTAAGLAEFYKPKPALK